MTKLLGSKRIFWLLLFIATFFYSSVQAIYTFSTGNTTVTSTSFAANNLAQGFTIPNGATVTWTVHAFISMITGPINIQAGGTLIMSDGTITLTSTGSITNAGDISITSGGGISNTGTITNTAGTVYIDSTSALINNSGGVITLDSASSLSNAGWLNNSGTITNNGVVGLAIGSTVANATSSTAISVGSFPATTTTFSGYGFTGSGAVIPLLVTNNISTSDVTAAACTNGFIVAPGAAIAILIPVVVSAVGGQIIVGSNAVLTLTNASLSSAGTITNSGTIIVNNGSMTNAGTITNTGGILHCDANSVLTNSSGLISIDSTSALSVAGTLTNGGTITNNGAVGLAVGSVVNRLSAITTSSFPSTTNSTLGFSVFSSGVVVPLLVSNNISSTSGDFLPAACVNGFVVAPSATVTMSSDVSISASSGRIVINDNGTLKLSGITLTNAGKIIANGGSLYINPTGTLINSSSGVMSVGSAGALSNAGILTNNGTITNNGVVGLALGSKVNSLATIAVSNFPTAANSTFGFSGSGGVVPLLVSNNISTTSGDVPASACTSGFVVAPGASVSMISNVVVTGGQVVIGKGATLMPMSASLTADSSTIINNGTVSLSIGSLSLLDNSLLTNRGSFTIDDSSTVSIDAESVFSNYRGATVTDKGTLTNKGIVINAGTINATTSATLNNFLTISNISGSIYIDATSTLSNGKGGTISVDSASALNNAGKLTNSDTITNNGVVGLALGSKINSKAAITTSSFSTATNSEFGFGGSGSIIPLIISNNISANDGDFSAAVCASGFAVAGSVSLKVDVAVSSGRVVIAPGGLLTMISPVIFSIDSASVVSTIGDGSLVIKPGATMNIIGGELSSASSSITNNGVIRLANGSVVNGNTVVVANFPATNTTTNNSAFNPGFSSTTDTAGLVQQIYVFTADTTVDHTFFANNNLQNGFRINAGVVVTWVDTTSTDVAGDAVGSAGVILAGKLVVQSGATFISGGALTINTGGVLDLSGTDGGGSAIINLYKDIVNNGTIDLSGEVGTSNANGSGVNGGTLTVYGGNITNNGVMNFIGGAGGNNNTTNSYTNPGGNGGALKLYNGTLTNNGSLVMNGGNGGNGNSIGCGGIFYGGTGGQGGVIVLLNSGCFVGTDPGQNLGAQTSHCSGSVGVGGIIASVLPTNKNFIVPLLTGNGVLPGGNFTIAQCARGFAITTRQGGSASVTVALMSSLTTNANSQIYLDQNTSLVIKSGVTLTNGGALVKIGNAELVN